MGLVVQLKSVFWLREEEVMGESGGEDGRREGVRGGGRGRAGECVGSRSEGGGGEDGGGVCVPRVCVCVCV